MELTRIGLVHSPVREPVDEGWGNVVADIRLDEPYERGLEGIEQYSHILVVFWMHRADFDAGRDLVRRPRGRSDMDPVGIFAQRAKHRPNPLGITAVPLLSRSGGTLVVRGLDAVDGTPVVDIKPYIPLFDRVESAVVPEWAERLLAGYC